MIKSRIPLFVIAFFSISIALGSYRFFGLGLDDAFADMAGHLMNRKVAFVMHISAAPFALILGAIQLFPKLRSKNKTLHRWLGRFYGVAVLLAGISGLVIAATAAGGIVAQLGFGILSVLWLSTTSVAIYYAVKRKIGLHRRWIIRSFSLTFAAVTLRLYLPIFFMNGFDYTQASVYIAWMCWVPNLIFAEWWLRRKKK